MSSDNKEVNLKSTHAILNELIWVCDNTSSLLSSSLENYRCAVYHMLELRSATNHLERALTERLAAAKETAGTLAARTSVERSAILKDKKFSSESIEVRITQLEELRAEMRALELVANAIRSFEDTVKQPTTTPATTSPPPEVN